MSNTLASGSILCDERTYDASKTFMEFEDAGKIKVKGKPEPIAVFRPIRLMDKSPFGIPVPGDLSQSFMEYQTIPVIMKQFHENKKRVVFINGDEREALYVLARLLHEEAGKFDIDTL
jgi:hypothetical protein